MKAEIPGTVLALGPATLRIVMRCSSSLRIPLKLDARSTAKRTAIPRQTGRPFQRKLDTSERSDAGLIVFYAEATGSVNFARRLRCDSPVSLNV